MPKPLRTTIYNTDAVCFRWLARLVETLNAVQAYNAVGGLDPSDRLHLELPIQASGAVMMEMTQHRVPHATPGTLPRRIGMAVNHTTPTRVRPYVCELGEEKQHTPEWWVGERGRPKFVSRGEFCRIVAAAVWGLEAGRSAC